MFCITTAMQVKLIEDKELCLRKWKKIIFFAVSALFPSQMKMKNVMSFL